jgi:hypothetical protein
MLSTVLLIAAFLLFAISACNVPSRVNLLSAGLACWALSDVVARGLLH